MAGAATITPKKRTARQWNNLLSQENSISRETILPTLASSSLIRNCPGQWIPVLDFFEESAMHGLGRDTVLKSLFSGSFLDSYGTQAYKFGEDRSIFLRHKFAVSGNVMQKGTRRRPDARREVSTRKKRSSKQSKTKGLHISVMPAEPAINARGSSRSTCLHSDTSRRQEQCQ
jgi:hypothetical protein